MIIKKYSLFIENKLNNEEGTLITIDDIINCIKNKGLIYVSSVKGYPDLNKEEGITPLDIDKDGLITVSIDNNEYTVDIKNVTEIEN